MRQLRRYSRWGRPLTAAHHTWISKEDIPWDWFFTGTFRSSVSCPWRAERHAVWWLRRVSRAALGARRGRKELVRSLVAVELHASGDAHVHVLVADVGHLAAKSFYELWRNRFGHAELAPFDPDLEGLWYVLKAADKGGLVWVANEVFA